MIDLRNLEVFDRVSVRVFVSNLVSISKSTKSRDNIDVIECELSDSSGTVYGSFLERSNINDRTYYDLEGFRMHINRKNGYFELQ